MTTNEILVKGYKEGTDPLAIATAVEVLRILGSDPRELMKDIPMDYMKKAAK